MSAPTSTLPAEPRRRHARAAVSVLFFVNAILYANLVPRLPAVKAQLGLDNAAFGAAIAAMPVGALAAGLLAPAFIARFGSARVAAFGLVLLAAAVLGVPLAGTWLGFAAAMLAVGALDAVVDVAQNAHGFRVQRLYGRSIVNAFHGLWSVGAVAGGLLGSAAAGLGIPLAAHLAASAAFFGAVALVAYRFLLTGPEDAERAVATADDAGHSTGTSGLRRIGARALLPLAALGTLAAAAAFVEDAGFSWGALYLRGEVGVGAAAGGLAFVALQLAMTVGRLTGDRVVDRIGQRRVALWGGAAIALGMGIALAVPALGTTLAGFALAGLGVATLVPAVMHAADELPGLPAGVGLTIVSWLLRVGFLVSPAAVGLVADAAGLRVALLGTVASGLVVLALSRTLGARPATGPDDDREGVSGTAGDVPAAKGS